MGDTSRDERFVIDYSQDVDGQERFVIYSIVPDTMQYRLESTFDKGPFDTNLEVAQWAWRVIARCLPPST